MASPMDLTRRQREVATLVAGGATNREIGDALGLSDRTAGSYVSHILQRLALRSRTELAIWANEHGLGRAAGAAVHATQPTATRPS